MFTLNESFVVLFFLNHRLRFCLYAVVFKSFIFYSLSDFFPSFEHFICFDVGEKNVTGKIRMFDSLVFMFLMELIIRFYV